jgi:hypothetical protein
VSQRDAILHVRGSLAVTAEKDEIKEDEIKEEEEEEEEEEEVWKKEWLASAKVKVEPGHTFSKYSFF